MGRDGGSCAKVHLRDAPSPWQAGTGLGNYNGLQLTTFASSSLGSWRGSLKKKNKNTNHQPYLLILRYIPLPCQKEHEIQLNTEVIRVLRKQKWTGEEIFSFFFPAQ